MSKSVPQLTEKTDREDDDLFHMVRDNIDYKQKRSNLFETGADVIYTATLTIATASVLTLNGTPITIVASPGAGKYIEVVSASATMTFNSAAYATNTTLQLINAGADAPQKENAIALVGTVTRNTTFYAGSAPTAGQTQIIADTALQVKVETGNPTAGNSDIKVKVSYRIVTI